MHPSWLWASAALATLAATAEVPTTPQQLEVDIGFPRNETYKPTDVLPIVLAIQNITAATSLGDLRLDWAIEHLVGGQYNSSTRSKVASGFFELFTNGTWTDKPAILTTATNVTDWIPLKAAVDDRYLLQWQAGWLTPPCGGILSPGAELPTAGALTFNIQTAGEEVQQGSIPECPEFGGLVRVGPAPEGVKPACPEMDVLETRQGNPCAVKIDQAAASSIVIEASRVASFFSSVHHPTPTTAAKTAATAAATTTATTTAATAATTAATVASSTSKAGAGLARPLQTALAAACVLCGLAL